ncbi:MAG: hypothetical protein H0X41_12595 [Chitinophagaceae bacterium]|nr:hypothetical protein [Chitinophagaceae bacterium]
MLTLSPLANGEAVSGTLLAATALLASVSALAACCSVITSFLQEDKASNVTAAKPKIWFLKFMDDELLNRKTMI